MLTVRELARQSIEAFLREQEIQGTTVSAIDQLSSEDRGLYHELTMGALREWGFLHAVVKTFAKRAPKGSVKAIVTLSAYQLLFLDRVPNYAVFSEAKKMCESAGCAESETKFIHGVLKSIERDKVALLKQREVAFSNLCEGRAPDSDLEWAVLNASKNLVDSLTVNDPAISKRLARPRAIKALVAMRKQSSLVGYILPERRANAVNASLESEVAPHAKVFEPSQALKQDLENGIVRIQGEASQWSCELAAKLLFERSSSTRRLRVLEMAAGKGGKTLGTLVALTRLFGGHPKDVPSLDWLAADASGAQLKIFECDTQKIISEIWPQVNIEVLQTAFSTSPFETDDSHSEQRNQFDLIWLDAPCTGFGTIAKLPQIALTRGEQAYENAKRMSLIQQDLCLMGFNWRAPDSRFLYSVCTLTHPETFGILEFCTSQANVKVDFSRSLWPGHPPAPSAEGFFCAVFR